MGISTNGPSGPTGDDVRSAPAAKANAPRAKADPLSDEGGLTARSEQRAAERLARKRVRNTSTTDKKE